MSVAPGRAAALARLAAVRPHDYARTRNHLDGAVTGLSPYLTHGLLELPEVLARVLAHNPLPVQHKLVFELGWRAYFRHVWAHRGDSILESLHAGLLPDAVYTREVPADIREARCGLAVIDQAVRTLYATGTLHNHARMWLASYVVHLRKVHWRAGADWLYTHLLDGDLASNHLSWQWVAGTGSRQPYLFNAENVARYAPAAWQCAGSVVDTSYEQLQAWAGDALAVLATGPAGHDGVDEPPGHTQALAALALRAPEAPALRGRKVWLLHPWHLSLPRELPADTVVLGVYLADFHRQWPWSAARWQFVDDSMAELTSWRCHADVRTLQALLAGAAQVQAWAEPHVQPWLGQLAQTIEPVPLFAPQPVRCDSFSRWWTRSTRGLRRADELVQDHSLRADGVF
ncbi:MAG: FAD-binding domain-containing protein [Curvibacter sp.]|jgi:deoxyribodipyrimidine photo-lyase